MPDSPRKTENNTAIITTILPLLVHTHCIAAPPTSFGDGVGEVTFGVSKSLTILARQETLLVETKGPQYHRLGKERALRPWQVATTQEERKRKGLFTFRLSRSSNHDICIVMQGTDQVPPQRGLFHCAPFLATLHNLMQKSYARQKLISRLFRRGHLTSRADDVRADVPTDRCISNGIIFPSSSLGNLIFWADQKVGQALSKGLLRRQDNPKRRS